MDTWRKLVGKRISLWADRQPTYVWFAIPTGVLMVVFFCLAAAQGGDELLPLQLGPSTKFRAEWVPEHLLWDNWFIGAYFATAQLLVWRLWSSKRSGVSGRRVVLALPFLLVVADITENIVMTRLQTRVSSSMITWLHVAAHVKWGLVIVLLGAIAWQVRAAAPRAVMLTQSPQALPDEWVCAPSNGVPSGIACSGGGIRSAAFSMGALHGLGPEAVRSAKYLSAVSGGAYTAAAMSVAAAGQTNPTTTTALPFGRESAEMRQLRAHSSFLFLNGTDGRLSAFRAVAALVVNLLVLFASLFLVARPIGWAAGALHPELEARGPFLGDFGTKNDWTASIELRTPPGPATTDPARASACPSGVTPSYWNLQPDDAGSFKYARREGPRSGEPLEQVVAAGPPPNALSSTPPTWQSKPGLVRTCRSSIEILRQPKMSASDEVRVSVQPRFRVVDDLAAPRSGVKAFDDDEPPERAIERRLVVEREPEIVTAHSVDVTTSRANITIEGWMWTVGVVLAGLCVLVFAFPWQRHKRFTLPTMRRGGLLFTWLQPIAAAWWAVVILMPWLDQELPRLWADLPNVIGGGKQSATSSIGSAIVWFVGAAVSSGIAKFATKLLSGGDGSKPRRIGLSVLKVATYVAMGLTGLIAAISIANYGAMVGLSGRGLGADAAESWVAYGRSDLADWLVVLVGMLVIKEVVATHSWSLNPIYRDRIAAAFSLRTPGNERVRAGRLEPFFGTTAPVAAMGEEPTDDSLISFTELPQEKAAQAWPELILCCAANINDGRSQLAAKRWADSFIVTPTHIGSPTLGYYSMSTYYERLSRRRKRDLLLASVVATSGAAFSPAMGNMDMGPIGGLFAVLNLRLGLWMPNPLSVCAETESTDVATFNETNGKWRGTPGWPHLLKEVFGRYAYHDPFVYTTDGGHWDNLGLVELLRHGCRQIVVLSAAGDSSDFFPTLGDSIALAREETGIDIHIDTSKLRPRRGSELPKEGRQLLRWKGTSVEPQAMAEVPYAVGWFNRNGKKGCVLFIEAALTPELPWDVHTFAEQHDIFPDHPTTNQFYSHRTFEAYRRLGEHQAKVAWASTEWQDVCKWAAGSVGGDVPPGFLAPDAPVTPPPGSTPQPLAVTVSFE